ncbi:Putative S-adenosyl-L-methionine-dependent methyltransferase [Septoria linicola]|uniref:S-adenosyl-L-methionine-dependent methyltransferase n=1 Tax=Septoria linicola TaxID=215465 RepID=A0A9Q9B579_9PEZI|nr:putative S-adenosyl-L-methionine-dependent methyltransferase [Septoria linicola]USW56561.1 Putative S-adenosyl-L-methionine-dependent methyltransferase [Septoria linicola]
MDGQVPEDVPATVPAEVAEVPAQSFLGSFDPDENDADSGYAASITGTDTTSLLSSIARYREENGRTYHSYGSTEHWGPNDDKAQDQQDLSHHLWTLALKGRHYLAPVQDPQHILDIGTGTGIWAIEVAEALPDAEVTGLDLSPIQPAFVPPNCFFEIDDYNVDWLDHDKYDLIHARELLGSAPDWPAVYKQAFSALKPGGYLEAHEPSLFFTSDAITLGPDHPFPQWGQMMVTAGTAAGMPFDIGDKMKGWMEEAGFVNVTEYRMPWLIGGWSKDEHQRQVGQWNQLRLDLGVADFCSRRFTNHMGFSPQEIEVFCARLRAAFRDKRTYGYQWAYFVYGQRPIEVEGP